MVLEVVAGEYAVCSGNETLHGHASQCVLVAVRDLEKDVFGLAHIGYNSDYARTLDGLLDRLEEEGLSNSLQVMVVGGVYAFIPQHGPIFGDVLAARVVNYLKLSGLRDVMETHVKTDFIRDIYVNKHGMMYEEKAH